ncbi:hypothetical protein Tco_0311959 [Tanacetum coccineum]
MAPDGAYHSDFLERQALECALATLKEVGMFILSVGLYGEYLNKRSAARAAKQKDGGEFHPSLRRDMKLAFYRSIFKLESIIQIIRLADQRQQDDISKMADEAEQKIESEIQRLYDHTEARLNKIAEEEKLRKFIGHMNSSAHMKLAIKRCVPKKRKYVDVMRSPFSGLSETLNVPSMEQLANQNNVLNLLMIEKCKSVNPWIEDLKRPFNKIDRIFFSHDLEEWLSRYVVGHCKFPWCNDISVDRSFWHGLCGLDDNHKGWLVDENLLTGNEDEETVSKEKDIDKLMSLISLSFKKIYKPIQQQTFELIKTPVELIKIILQESTEELGYDNQGKSNCWARKIKDTPVAAKVWDSIKDYRSRSGSDPVHNVDKRTKQDSLSPGPQSQENVPQVADTVTMSNELELLYSPMFSELLNGTSHVVSKSSAVHAADNPDKRQQHNTNHTSTTTDVADPPPLNIHSTHPTPTQVPTVTAPENIIQVETNTENAQFNDNEFINIFTTPVQEQGETSSHHVDSSNMHTFYQHHLSAQRWTKDHPLEQVIGNPSQSLEQDVS